MLAEKIVPRASNISVSLSNLAPLPVEITPPWSSLLLQEGQFLKKKPCRKDPVENPWTTNQGVPWAKSSGGGGGGDRKIF